MVMKTEKLTIEMRFTTRRIINLTDKFKEHNLNELFFKCANKTDIKGIAEIIKRSKFVGDSREGCFSEAGDIMIPLAEGHIEESHFYAELGDVLIGKLPGRESDDEITLFKSNGLAIQDVATAKLIYDKAVEAGIGAEIEI